MKTLNQVITDIKQGEVWRTEHTRIYLNNVGDLMIKDIDYIRNNDINVLGHIIAINLKSEYWLEDKVANLVPRGRSHEELREGNNNS